MSCAHKIWQRFSENLPVRLELLQWHVNKTKFLDSFTKNNLHFWIKFRKKSLRVLFINVISTGIEPHEKTKMLGFLLLLSLRHRVVGCITMAVVLWYTSLQCTILDLACAARLRPWEPKHCAFFTAPVFKFHYICLINITCTFKNYKKGFANSKANILQYRKTLQKCCLGKSQFLYITLDHWCYIAYVMLMKFKR